MKKTIIFILIVAAAVYAAVIASPLALPDLDEVEPDFALGDDGTVYMISNTVLGSWIYGLDPSMVPVSVYHEISLSKYTYIDSVAFGNGSVYFVRITTPGDKNPSGSWELLKANAALSGVEVLYSGAFKGKPPRSGITAEGGKVYLTTISDPSSFVTVSVIEGGEGLKTILEAYAPEGEDVVDAAYRSEILSCLLKSGRFIQFRTSISPVFTAGKQTTVEIFSADGPDFFVADSEGYVYNISGLSVGVKQPADALMTVIAGAASGDGSFVMLASSGDGVSVIRSSDGNYTAESTVRLTAKARILFKLPLLKAASILLLAFAVVILIISGLVKKLQKLSVRLTAAVALTLVVLVVVFAAVPSGMKLDESRKEALSEASAIAALCADSILPDMLKGISQPSFFGSEQHDELLGRFGTVAGAFADKTRTVYTDFLAVDGTDIAVRVSETFSNSVRAAQAYGIEAENLISAAVETRSPQSGVVMHHGTPTAVHALPVARFGNIVGVIVARVSAGNILLDLFGVLEKLAIPGGFIFVAGLLITMLLNLRYLRPLKLVARRMNDITLGGRNIPESETGVDEIAGLWKAMKELCVSLAIKDYETENLVRSFYKFVPRELEKLLDRASVMEVEVGDSATISGSVCTVFVGNIDSAREKLDDESFMSFINRSITLISRNVSACDGILLTAGSEVSSLKTIFRNSADDAMNFTLKLLGDSANGTGDPGLPPTFFLMLHNASFLYGMAGSDERAFPLLSSSEMAFLDSVSEKLMETGVKIVATEKYLDSLNIECTSRYLGFITPGHSVRAYKIYEILDAYPDIEKAKRVRVDDKFQEGIRLFYKNDFYLARNAFSTVVKEVPGDGVARWYLYACEHYFTNPDTAEPRYDLFGLDQ